MMKVNSKPVIRAKANELIKRFDITALPVDPFKIAEKLDIQICAKPSSQKGGMSGALVRSGNNFGILYATDIPNIGYQRFTVAHEIGHYVLDGHMDHLQLQDGDIHYSKVGFHGDKYEREANYFAAQLLMPDTLFTKTLAANEDGMNAIKKLADTCQTSLTATAIRYVEKTDSISAVVGSKKDKILYAFFSDEMCRFTPGWPSQNSPLPASSLTYEINHRQDFPRRGEANTNIDDWFECNFDLEGKEEALHLGKYEKTLTLLTFRGDYEDALEEEDIAASWRPKF